MDQVAEEFQPGDVVMLKSGGPAMTVTKTDDLLADCIWFSDAKFPISDVFRKATIKKVPA